jgi:hypothetical protein
MFAWFRRPRASLELQVAPSPASPDGAVTVRVHLTPHEPFQIRRGCVALIYTETCYSPTALDGYHEHTSERVYVTEAIAENVRAQPGVTLEYGVELQVPAQPPPRRESRPARLAWQVRASFHLRGFRDIHQTYHLADLTPRDSGVPEVDGRRQMPYERILPLPADAPARIVKGVSESVAVSPPYEGGDLGEVKNAREETPL